MCLGFVCIIVCRFPLSKISIIYLSDFHISRAEISVKGPILDVIKWYTHVNFLKKDVKLTQENQLINVSNAWFLFKSGFSVRVSSLLAAS